MRGVNAALPRMRAQAESLMVDTTEVVRLGEPYTDPETGVVVTPEDVVYTGPCRVQTYEPHEENPEVGSSTVTVQRYALHIPVGSYEPEIGDLAEITAARHDASLVGRRYRVVALLHKSLATAYRLGVEIIE